MIIFDYLFYRFHGAFKKLPRKTYTADIQSLCALTTLQCMNIGFVLFIFCYIKDINTLGISKIWYAIPILILMFLNYLRYWGDNNIASLTKKWKDEEKNIKIRRGIYVIFYVVISIGLCVWSADFVGRYFRNMR